MKAIETIYKGYRMRSRLEARWAVFFDTLGVAWEYEKEGYVLSDGSTYLPDFWLPDLDCWIEIKGKKPTEQEVAAVEGIVRGSGKHAYIFFGDIPLPTKDAHGTDRMIIDSAYAFKNPLGGYDSPYYWCECEHCGKVGIEFDGRSARIDCPCNPDDDKCYNYASERLIAAYTAARRARFEHGEHGR